jgi:hypothetical protein
MNDNNNNTGKDLYKAAFSKVQSACTNKMEVITMNLNNQHENTGAFRRRGIKKSVVAAVAVALIAALSITTYALVSRRLSPAEVADELGQGALAESFRDGDAIIIEETVISGGRIVTLHGITIGSGLDEYVGTDVGEYVGELERDRTYIVFSVANEDGTPIDYVNTHPHFMSTVFFEGYRPWLLSSWSLGMGASGFEHDGVFYKILQMNESIEMLADRTVYLGIWDGIELGMVPFHEAILFDENDGTISFAEGLQAMHAMFVLPLDPEKADFEALRNYMEERGELESLEWADFRNCLDELSQRDSQDTFDMNDNNDNNSDDIGEIYFSGDIGRGDSDIWIDVADGEDWHFYADGERIDNLEDFAQFRGRVIAERGADTD